MCGSAPRQEQRAAQADEREGGGPADHGGPAPKQTPSSLEGAGGDERGPVGLEDAAGLAQPGGQLFLERVEGNKGIAVLIHGHDEPPFRKRTTEMTEIVGMAEMAEKGAQERA
ncbi:hypothetical protein GCM10022403_073600 [Streptomyces coacervatus]|uniref:Uncharacterized protein n=1 Tax=Streptomyces coacervatus TaxID=647381 RepID=A0ABP7IXS7_9ACTN